MENNCKFPNWTFQLISNFRINTIIQNFSKCRELMRVSSTGYLKDTENNRDKNFFHM